jgi:inner membrane protein YidH
MREATVVEPPEQVADASRRTYLAGERTYLAWWRSGLTALALGVGAGRIGPDLAKGSAWELQVLGLGYVLLGMAVIAYGLYRQRALNDALARGHYAPLSTRGATVLAVGAIVLGLATIVVIFQSG